jgi:hypothetical protein
MGPFQTSVPAGNASRRNVRNPHQHTDCSTVGLAGTRARARVLGVTPGTLRSVLASLHPPAASLAPVGLQRRREFCFCGFPLRPIGGIMGMPKLSRHRGETASPTRSTPLLSWFLEAVLGNGSRQAAQRMIGTKQRIREVSHALVQHVRGYTIGGVPGICAPCICALLWRLRQQLRSLRLRSELLRRVLSAPPQLRLLRNHAFLSVIGARAVAERVAKIFARAQRGSIVNRRRRLWGRRLRGQVSQEFP